MPTNKIEIYENTLLKLLVRRGLDSDRKAITLSEGELGFSTDTKRLFIGDSVTSGGILIGNKFKGSATSVTSFAPAEIGDLAYDSDNFKLYRLKSNTGTSASDWEEIGGVYTAGDSTISVNTNNNISVGVISAGNISSNALGNSIELSSNKISLSSTISVDRVILKGTDASNYLGLPQKIAINNVSYKFPSTTPSSGQFLGATGVDNNLIWNTPNITYTAVAPTTAALIPVGTIVPFVSGYSQVPYGWIPCDGRSIATATYPELSGVIGYQYGGSGTSFNVPDLTNKSVYGASNPITSTLWHVGSSGPVSLSAIGMAYIIKAIGGVTSSTLTVQSPLTAMLNNVLVTNTSINPLSGDVKIGLPDLPGLAKGWVRFRGDGGNTAIYSQYNIASVTRGGTGQYTFTFTTPMKDANYTVVGNGDQSNTSGGNVSVSVISRSTAQFSIRTLDTDAQNVVYKDTGDCSLTIHGN
jgi:microcystin-dependent protein